MQPILTSKICNLAYVRLTYSLKFNSRAFLSLYLYEKRFQLNMLFTNKVKYKTAHKSDHIIINTYLQEVKVVQG